MAVLPAVLDDRQIDQTVFKYIWMKRRLPAIRVLSLLALALSAYLAWTSLSGTVPAGCSQEGSGCSEVLGTRWALWFGLPVSVGGALVYAALAWIAFLISDTSPPARWRQLAFLSVMAAGAGLWFTALQLFVIKGFCYYCMVTHACGIAIAVLTLTAGSVVDTPLKKKSKQKETQPAKLTGAALLGLLGAITLAAGQLVSLRISAVPEKSQTPVSYVAPVPLPSDSGEVLMAGGQLKLDLSGFPVFGPPHAERIVALLYDYTCPACRHLHPLLVEERRKYDNRGAVFMIPMPLDAQCNPGVPQTSYEHRDACNYAKIGLALWKINPETFFQYDQFMFSLEYPPTIEQARSFADGLVSHEVMETLLADPDNDQLVSYGVQLFYSPLLRRKVLPTLFTPDEVIEGSLSPQQLAALFR